MGTELKAMGVFKSVSEYTTLWSAAALLHKEGREAVKAAHRSFIDAGAQLIITNTYALTGDILSKAGLQHRQEELISSACQLAHEAVAESGKPCLVAGSLPPLSVSYRPDLVKEAPALRQEYSILVEALAKGGVDVFIAETMSNVQEASAAANAAAAAGKPIFVAVTRYLWRTPLGVIIGPCLSAGPDAPARVASRLRVRGGRRRNGGGPPRSAPPPTSGEHS